MGSLLIHVNLQIKDDVLGKCHTDLLFEVSKNRKLQSVAAKLRLSSWMFSERLYSLLFSAEFYGGINFFF